MNDLFSKQAVVECVYKALRTPPLKGVFTDTMSLAIRMVNDLPSAQPDTTTHDSIHAETGKNYGDRTSGDCISRQAAIDTIEKHLKWTTIPDYYPAIFEAVREWLNSLPSAQPEQRWIPISEKLPEELEKVNVTWVNHKPEQYYDFVKDKPFTASAVYYKGNWYWYSSICTDLLAEYGENEIDKIDDAIEITAWMPLPEPYQERGEQE